MIGLLFEDLQLEWNNKIDPTMALKRGKKDYLFQIRKIYLALYSLRFGY